MNPAVATALIQALITLGPSALQAIEAIIKAMHGQPVSDAEHQELGRALTMALQQSKAG